MCVLKQLPGGKGVPSRISSRFPRLGVGAREGASTLKPVLFFSPAEFALALTCRGVICFLFGRALPIVNKRTLVIIVTAGVWGCDDCV